MKLFTKLEVADKLWCHKYFFPTVTSQEWQLTELVLFFRSVSVPLGSSSTDFSHKYSVISFSVCPGNGDKFSKKFWKNKFIFYSIKKLEIERVSEWQKDDEMKKLNETKSLRET